MKTTILDLKLFLFQGVLFRGGGLQSQLPQGTQLPFCSLLGCDFTILRRGRKDCVECWEQSVNCIPFVQVIIAISETSLPSVREAKPIEKFEASGC